MSRFHVTRETVCVTGPPVAIGTAAAILADGTVALAGGLTAAGCALIVAGFAAVDLVRDRRRGEFIPMPAPAAADAAELVDAGGGR